MYEPSSFEIWMTLTLGNSLAIPFYTGYIERLPLHGDENLLDFGSGSGVCSRHLLPRLPQGRLTCMDISWRWQQVARQTLSGASNVDFIQGDVTQMDLPAASFDAVFIHFVLHDIPAEQHPAVLSALTRLVRPGGALYLREPVGRGALSENQVHRMIEAAGWKETYHYHNRHWFTGPVYEGNFIKL
jgi:ubiquinone/menaquinone biosynthesis C-methylase UbiE